MPEIIYKCKYCGKTFTTVQEATACESKHANITKVSVSEYTVDGLYPEKLSCTMSNGAVLVYEREGSRLSKQLKWYVGTLSAEGITRWVAELTEQEVEIIRSFLDYTNPVTDEAYSGCCRISSECFDTRDDAVQAILYGGII